MPTVTNFGVLSTIRDHPDERVAYIALALTPRVGSRKLARLLSTFGSPSAVLSASLRDLRAIDRMDAETANAIAAISPEGVTRALHDAESLGCRLMIPADACFPAVLRSIPGPPTLLWYRGDLGAFTLPAVAIVGSRDHTRYGGAVASMMARAAAEAGIMVVSGMARGLDAIAHNAALDAGCGTIGVVANGLDVVYPPGNQGLYERVYERGLLVSEHAPGVNVVPAAFARRNRLISGLARAVLVVEAAPDSGTMLTVASALDQGREVFAVPGPIDSRTSEGTNRLILDGATPLLNVEQFLAWFGKAAAPRAAAPRTPPCDLGPTEAQVYHLLSDSGAPVDDIALGAGLPIGTVLGALLGLELGGIAEQMPGGLYRRRMH